jgi:probable HAF family extracellular repeat protein
LFDRVHGMRMLGTLGGPSSHGMALNQEGMAAGFADTADGQWHAFLYQPGAPLKDLGTLGGKISYASGINARGQVVGTASLPSEYRRAFLYDPQRGMVDLGTLGGRSSSASAINDHGVVVGVSETRQRKLHAFLHDGHRMIDLGALIGRGSSFATDINNAGHVVGTALIGDERMSWVWRNNTMTVHRGGKGLHLTHSINDREQVIGAIWDRRYRAATMWSNAAPVVGDSLWKIPFLLILAMTLAGLAVFFRKRYQGIALPSLAA